MVHSTARNNFKAKWLAALESDAARPVDSVQLVEKAVNGVSTTVTDASISLGQISHSAMEAASQAIRLSRTLSEFQTVSQIDFGDISHGIDEKLTKMPIPVMMRRVRDILKIAEMRIGILSVMAEEAGEAVKSMEQKVRSLGSEISPLQVKIVEHAWIGTSPTSSEFEDYKDKTSDYHRYGIQYDDLDDDWFDTRLGNATLRQPAAEIPSPSSPSSPATALVSMRRKNHALKSQHRASAIIPTTDSENEDGFSI